LQRSLRSYKLSQEHHGKQLDLISELDIAEQFGKLKTQPTNTMESSLI
jgi:hypothetical protein